MDAQPIFSRSSVSILDEALVAGQTFMLKRKVRMLCRWNRFGGSGSVPQILYLHGVAKAYVCLRPNDSSERIVAFIQRGHECKEHHPVRAVCHVPRAGADTKLCFLCLILRS